MIRLLLGQKRILVEPGQGAGAWEFFPDANFLASPYGPIVIIVHGYNNDQDEAAASYRLLRENLREILEDNRQRLNHIWEFYWPGYLPKGALLPSRLPTNLASAASYSYQESKTTGLGKSFASYIRKIPPRDPSSRPEVIFIAHSLGCRVVMETLRHLDAAPVRVLGVCLMAAAVPVFKVEPAGDLRGGVEKPEKIYILYSPSDWVLHWAFRPGQFLLHPTTFPEAVGRFGNPFHGSFSVLDNVVNTGLGHSDYYRGRPAKSSQPSRTRTTIARLFGRQTPNLLKDRYIVEWPPLPTSAAPAENRLVENALVEN